MTGVQTCALPIFPPCNRTKAYHNRIIGTAGVPGSGMIMLAMVLQSVGLPVEGVALVAGVDRILDMMRTTVNVTGDAAVATCVDAMQKRAAARRARKAEKLAKAA